MAAQVKILVEGYTNADSFIETGEEHTRPTVTLVRDENVIMVVDPGVMQDPQILVDALSKENLTVNDVNFVCLTHSHIDHYRNIGLFPKAKTLEHYGLWDKDTVKDWPENFSPNIQILHTPGHDHSGLSLFVTTKDGVVAICGDIFWKENYPATPIEDMFASDTEQLAQSRSVVLRRADWIIPGHGKIYKNTKKVVEEKVKEEPKESGVIFKCRKCGIEMKKKERCNCRQWLCYKCCECHIDCDNCRCSHLRK